MKKPLILLCLSALAVAFGTACNESGSEPPLIENEVMPISVSSDVSSFFDDYQNLYVLGRSVDYGFNPYANIEIGEPRFTEDELPFVGGCVMINSVNELPKSGYDGITLNYPAIDFDSNTLVVGVFIDYGGQCVTSKNLVVEQNVATMNISIGPRNDGDFHHLMEEPAYFWAI